MSKGSIGGFTLGTVIAVALSWGVNKSIMWAIIHGFLSWLYVIYYFLLRKNFIGGALFYALNFKI